MESQTSTPARRGVLTERDVNKAILSLNKGRTRCAEESSGLEGALLQKTMEFAIPGEIHKEVGLAGTKRGIVHCNRVGQEENEEVSVAQGSQRKKLKRPGLLQYPFPPTGDVLAAVEDVQCSDGSKERSSPSLAVTGCATTSLCPLQLTDQSSSPSDVEAVPQSPSPTASPASSGAFSEAELNNTQLTEPDKSIVVSNLTQSELQQKVQAMKLRLRLATYKVRTNQIHVPMSQLQVKSISSEPLPVSRLNLQGHASLSFTTIPHIPNIQIQKPSAEKARQPNCISSSPPDFHRDATTSLLRKGSRSPTNVGTDFRQEEFATPISPQAPLTKSVLGSPIWGGKSLGEELASSIVKRDRTADALLSLKLQL